MPKVQRSPPSGGNIHHSSSDADITNLQLVNPPELISKRSKRLRNEDHALIEFRDEIMMMLTNWRKDQEQSFKKMCSDIAEVKQQNTAIHQTNMEIEKAVQYLSNQYEDIKLKIAELELKREDNMKYVNSLENKIDDLQRRLKSTVIEFRNVPVGRQDRPETQQDMCQQVQTICKTLKIDLLPSDIKDVYRVRNNNGRSTIVTELSSTIIKNTILDYVKDYNKLNPNNKLNSKTMGFVGESVPVYISESLTSKDRRLFFLARAAAKSLSYKYCWVKNGRVFIKKTDGDRNRIEIKSDAQIESLKIQT